MKALFPALLAVLLCGCDSCHYHLGKFLQATHHELSALEHYEKLLARGASGPRTAEVHVLAGNVYRGLQRCLEARRHYEAAARDFPKLEPWARLAKAGVMDCPDYFPLDMGRAWTLGDSASGGKAARIELSLQGFGTLASATIRSELFAGQKRIRSEQVGYEKRDWGVWELRDKEKALILRYPFRKGESWTTTRGGKRLEYLIEDDDATVQTVGGKFSGCLKVREHDEEFPDTWKYDYFAPFVGRIKTSVAGPDYENPNIELIKYRQ